MGREEEIKKEAKNKYPYIKGLPQTVAHQEIFIEGAKWADETMIERFCKWLESTDIDMKYWNAEDGVCKELLIEDCKKTMRL